MSDLIQLKPLDRSHEEHREQTATAENQTFIVHKQSSSINPPSSMVPHSSTLKPQSSLDPRGTGKRYWRSLEELAETDEFQEILHREFPERASEWTDPVGRRRFLKLMGASFALAGLTACTRQPEEYIAPYVRQPEELVPGRPSFFATAMQLNGFATGLVVESHEGRPTKVEGNKDHPASLGAAGVFEQASVLQLYDPHRATRVGHG